MELWIRSQDKTTLIRSYEIYIVEYGKDSYVIRAKRTSHILGSYKSFERALEVLDEIQELLKPKFRLERGKIKGSFEGTIFKSLDKYEIQQMNCYVYEMPKE